MSGLPAGSSTIDAIGVDHTVTSLFCFGPELTELGLPLPVRAIHEREIAERGDESAHVSGAKLLPRQFVDNTRAELVGCKRARQRGVRRSAVVVRLQVPALHGAAMRLGGEDQPARVRDEPGFGGEDQRRPHRVRHWRAAVGDAAEAVEELRFGEPAPRRPQRAHRVADKPGPVTLEVALVAFENQREQFVQGVRRQVAVDNLADREMIAVLAQLVEDRTKEQRVAGRRRADEAGFVMRVEALRRALEKHADEIAALGRVESRDRGHRPSTVSPRFHRSFAAGRHHDSNRRRGCLGQPRQIGRAIDIVEEIGAGDEHHGPPIG